LAVRRTLEAAGVEFIVMAKAVGPGCACGRRINMESANKDLRHFPTPLGSCWQGVHGGQFRLLLDKRIGDAVTFAVHGGGSLFGVSAIKLVAIGDQLSTFEFGHAQAAPAFGRRIRAAYISSSTARSPNAHRITWMRRHSSPAMVMSGISNSQVSRLCPRKSTVRGFSRPVRSRTTSRICGSTHYVPRRVLKSRRTELVGGDFLERAPPVAPEGPGANAHGHANRTGQPPRARVLLGTRLRMRAEARFRPCSSPQRP